MEGAESGRRLCHSTFVARRGLVRETRRNDRDEKGDIAAVKWNDQGVVRVITWPEFISFG